MDALFRKIKENAGCNKPATPAQIAALNLKLKQAGFSPLPDDFANLLRLANGFSNEDVRIFGAEVQDSSRFDDLLTYNRRLFHDKPANWLVLGRDDYWFLIYIPSVKSYQVVDQDTLQPEISSESLEEPLLSILRI